MRCHSPPAAQTRAVAAAGLRRAGGSSTRDGSQRAARAKPVARSAAPVQAATPGGGSPSSTCSSVSLCGVEISEPP